MTKARFPYGVSNFETLVEEGYLYVDRTAYIERLEWQGSRFHFFLRPRRFGKSLFVSVLEYYYGKEHRDKFERLFGRYYIGQHPTPNANRYLVLKFDFSAIDTGNPDRLHDWFLDTVRTSAQAMLHRYPQLFGQREWDMLDAAQTPAQVIERILLFMEAHPSEKIFLLVDEYDHFTNELVAFHLDDFKQIVSRNGFVRKFYEAIKKGTQQGTIDRIFATGISPITLDSLTSGFNIASNLTLDLNMHDMMGFREEEVAELLRLAGVPEADFPVVSNDVRVWYNGYRFNKQAKHRLYNPDMVLYFASHYAQYNEYPDTLLDTNVSSDYGKIRRMLRVGNAKTNQQVLEEILREGSTHAALTLQYTFERPWTRDDFVSLLFYLGLLTIQKSEFGTWVFEVPNRVIEGLYYQHFQEVLLQEADMASEEISMVQRVAALARDDDMAPLANALQKVLERLSNRDSRGWSEKHVKAVLMALLVPTGVYGVFSEWPVGQGYADIYLKRRPPILEPRHEHLIELKYVKKEDAAQVEAVKEEGRQQVRSRLSHEDVLRQGDVLGWLVVVVGHEVQVEQVLPKVPSRGE